MKNITEVMGHLSEGLFPLEDEHQASFQEEEIRENLKKLNNIAKDEAALQLPLYSGT